MRPYRSDGGAGPELMEGDDDGAGMQIFPKGTIVEVPRRLGTAALASEEARTKVWDTRFFAMPTTPGEKFAGGTGGWAQLRSQQVTGHPLDEWNGKQGSIQGYDRNQKTFSVSRGCLATLERWSFNCILNAQYCCLRNQ